jgi:hypothetical protein
MANMTHCFINQMWTSQRPAVGSSDWLDRSFNVIPSSHQVCRVAYSCPRRDNKETPSTCLCGNPLFSHQGLAPKSLLSVQLRAPTRVAVALRRSDVLCLAKEDLMRIRCRPTLDRPSRNPNATYHAHQAEEESHRARFEERESLLSPEEHAKTSHTRRTPPRFRTLRRQEAE